jgi:predicted transcriptional regulator of viral defense system
VELEAFFYTNPVFRYEDFACLKAEGGEASNARATHKLLHYYITKGRLINVRRGIYAVVPPGAKPEQILIDPYLLASKAAKDSILAYHTALELHGSAYSVFEQFTFLTAYKIKPFEVQNRWFRPVTLPTVLKNSAHADFGIENLDRQGVVIRLTSPERTFVDVLDRIELSGGWEEVVRSVSNIAILRVADVIKYCLLLDNRILAAKVGYFLEQRQGAFAVGEDVLKPLLEKKPLTAQSLLTDKGEQGRLIKKWNIILPINLLNKTWEEPDYDV